MPSLVKEEVLQHGNSPASLKKALGQCTGGGMLYIGAQELLEDAFELGAAVLESGFRPSLNVTIWRG